MGGDVAFECNVRSGGHHPAVINPGVAGGASNTRHRLFLRIERVQPVPVQIADNMATHYNTGQRSSVFHGLSKAGTAAAYLVTPADMPRLERDHCSALLKAHETAPAGSITLPVGDRSSAFAQGNPVILTPLARDNVLRGGINLGCRGLLDSQPELINSFVTARDGYFIDIDTPEIYQAEYSVFMAGSGQPTPKEHTHGIE